MTTENKADLLDPQLQLQIAEAAFIGGICGLAETRDLMSAREFVDKALDVYDHLVQARLDYVMSTEDFLGKGGT